MSSPNRGISRDCFYEDAGDLAALGEDTYYGSMRGLLDDKAKVEQMKKDEQSFDVVECEDSASDVSADDGFVDLELDVGEEEEEIDSYDFVSKEIKDTQSAEDKKASSAAPAKPLARSAPCKPPMKIQEIMLLAGNNNLKRAEEAILGRYGVIENAYTPAWVKDGREKDIADLMHEVKLNMEKEAADLSYRMAARNFECYKREFMIGYDTEEGYKEGWRQFQKMFNEAELFHNRIENAVKWWLD